MIAEAAEHYTEQDGLTIIMSNYNQEAYLPQAVESVLAQNISVPYTLLLTDDCSFEDRSRELVVKYARDHENVEAILSDVRGGYLRNVLRAKERARTKYLCLLDADDYYTDKGFLQRAYDFLETHKEYAIYESNVMVVSENGTPIRPFIPAKVRSGTYSKEMLLAGKRVPITQTTGMFLRNSIFSRGVPEVMRGAPGTLSERSFEGDTGRFMMHLKEGLAYYDNRIVGTYRLTHNGIWSGLSKTKQRIITARICIDYYKYYGSCDGYFVNRALDELRAYLQEKRARLGGPNWEDEFMDDEERLMAEDVYLFCRQNKHLIVKTKVGLLTKVKRAIKALLS